MTIRVLASLLALGGMACGAKSGLDLRPPDGGRDADVCPPSAPVETEGCGLDAPNARISMTTSLGTFDMDHAWAGFQDGSCYSLLLQLSPHAARAESGPGRFPYVYVSMGVPTGPGSYDARYTLHTDPCTELVMIGVVEVETYEDPGDTVYDASFDGFCHCTGSVAESTCVPGDARRFLRARLEASDARGAILMGMLDAPFCHQMHANCY